MDMLNTSTIQITPEILKFISEIEEFKGAWRSLGAIAPERLLALKHIATIESVGSSTRIEGSKLSDQDVAKLLSNIGVHSFQTRDQQEVLGYAEVMDVVFLNFDNIPFSPNYIQQLHRDLLKYSVKDEHHRGKYKTLSNSVAAFEGGKQVATIFETATPFDTPRLMQELLLWVNETKEQQSLHPLLIVAVFVVVFLEIHPFQDGNGRLSRILTTLLLLQLGYAYVPYSALESVVEQNKSNYYLALRQTQGTIRTDNPNWQAWLTFFLQTLNAQVKRLKVKIEHEKIILSRLPDISIRLLDYVRAHGKVTVQEAETVLQESRNTIKSHLKKLVHNRHLVLHGAGRGVWYGLP